MVASLLTLFLLLLPACADAAGNRSFCAPEKPAVDFGLSSLPAVHELSEKDVGRELGHPAVSLYGGGWSKVMSKPGSFGYGFFEENYGGPVPVDWTVTAQFWAVDADGDALDEVGHTGLFLKTIDAEHQRHIGLKPPDRRGFYRFDLRIESEGKTIGSYSSYFKLVPPSWRPRLKLDRTTARPGQLIVSRLENLGSELISYGEEFFVQRRIKGRWSSARDVFGEGIWALWLGILDGGAIGRCSALHLPADTKPGRYRIVKNVGRLSGGQRDKAHFVVAPFRVVPSN